MRNVPTSFLHASFREESGDAFLALITINHPQFAAPIRVSVDAKDTESRGNTFVSYPVQVYLPLDEESRPPTPRLVIDNVDREITAALRSTLTNEPPTVLIEMVLSSNPEEVIMTFSDFRLMRASYDAITVEAELTLRDNEREPFPAYTFSPARFPNIYRQI